MIRNTHQRILKASASEIGELIDKLSSKEDKMWPKNNWPSMKFDRKLEVGAVGGHGPIRYVVEDYVPGKAVVFRFTGPKGFMGIHGFYTEETEKGFVKLEHSIEMEVKGFGKISWPLVYQPLHNALIEEALDNAESIINKKIKPQRSYSKWIKILRWSQSKGKHKKRQSSPSPSMARAK
jgi:hypothetical protein